MQFLTILVQYSSNNVFNLIDQLLQQSKSEAYPPLNLVSLAIQKLSQFKKAILFSLFVLMDKGQKKERKTRLKIQQELKADCANFLSRPKERIVNPDHELQASYNQSFIQTGRRRLPREEKRRAHSRISSQEPQSLNEELKPPNQKRQKINRKTKSLQSKRFTQGGKKRSRNLARKPNNKVPAGQENNPYPITLRSQVMKKRGRPSETKSKNEKKSSRSRTEERQDQKEQKAEKKKNQLQQKNSDPYYSSSSEKQEKEKQQKLKKPKSLKKEQLESEALRQAEIRSQENLEKPKGEDQIADENPQIHHFPRGYCREKVLKRIQELNQRVTRQQEIKEAWQRQMTPQKQQLAALAKRRGRKSRQAKDQIQRLNASIAQQKASFFQRMNSSHQIYQRKSQRKFGQDYEQRKEEAKPTEKPSPIDPSLHEDEDFYASEREQTEEIQEREQASTQKANADSHSYNLYGDEDHLVSDKEQVKREIFAEKRQKLQMVSKTCEHQIVSLAPFDSKKGKSFKSWCGLKKLRPVLRVQLQEVQNEQILQPEQTAQTNNKRIKKQAKFLRFRKRVFLEPQSSKSELEEPAQIQEQARKRTKKYKKKKVPVPKRSSGSLTQSD